MQNVNFKEQTCILTWGCFFDKVVNSPAVKRVQTLSFIVTATLVCVLVLLSALYEDLKKTQQPAHDCKLRSRNKLNRE